jgi:murein DD-endopeptidase MepM/ murein hydrolase activator NlpD
MRRPIQYLTLVYICFALVFGSTGAMLVFAQEAGAGDASTNLEDQIQNKNAELEYIKNQIADTQNKLETTQTQKQTLSSQLNRINSTINQIDLSIKSSKVTVERLDLESQVLRGDITQAEADLITQQAALGEVLREIQQKDNESILYIMIKNQTLSDSLLEVQALKDLYNDAVLKIQELNSTHHYLNNALNKTEQTKQNKERELSTLSSKKVIQQDLQDQKQTFLKETKDQEATYNQYIEDLKARQAQVLQDIFDIESKLRSGINYADLPDKLPGLLDTPIAKGDYVVTQGYGVTAYSKRFYASGFHNGVDLGAPIGTPIIAPSDGVVVAIGNQDTYCPRGAYGRFVVIKHYMGLTTLYGHMSLYVVKAGDTVKKGQIIGYVGNSGLATGPHLHFTIYDSTTFEMGQSRVCGPMPYGGSINPYNYVIF